MELFRFLNKETSWEDFENWTYTLCDELEKELSLDDYLEIMCFDYKRHNGYDMIAKLLFRNADKAEFENYRLKVLFTKALENDEILESALVEAFYLASGGNEIFRNAGYQYGLMLFDGELIGKENWYIAKSNRAFIDRYRKKFIKKWKK